MKRPQPTINQLRIKENEYTRFNSVSQSLESLIMDIGMTEKGCRTYGITDNENETLLAAISILEKTCGNMRRDTLQMATKISRN